MIYTFIKISYISQFTESPREATTQTGQDDETTSAGEMTEEPEMTTGVTPATTPATLRAQLLAIHLSLLLRFYKCSMPLREILL